MWTLENRDTCLIRTLSYDPKHCFIIKTEHDLRNQHTMRIKTCMIGPNVPRFQCTLMLIS